MTPRVPLVCTPEELSELLFWSGEVAVELYRLRIGGDNHDAADHAKARRDAALAALFRPAEEPDPLGFSAERMAQGESDVAAGRVVDLDAVMQRLRDNPPSAGGRAGNPMPAPATPPPAGESAPTGGALVVERSVQALVEADRNVSLARVGLRLVGDELAALRAENERLRGEMVTAQREAYVIGRRDGRLANNNPAPAKEEVVEGWRVAARNYYPSVPPGENRSEG